MRISWGWICDEMIWPDGKPTVSARAAGDLLTRRGLEVESCRDQGLGLELVVIVEIREKIPHPNSDRLSLCRVTANGMELLPPIVCGAQNMVVGDRVPLAMLGAQLPNGLKIVPATIRGEVSNGMLCARDELGLAPASPGDRSENGLWILPSEAPLGQTIAEYLGKTDWILEVKAPANRGDCLSHRGIARELAGALALDLKPLDRTGRQEWRGIERAELAQSESKNCKQILAARVSGLEARESPDWLKGRLEAAGSRSINTIVDWTNWVLLGLGQPVHAYDAKAIAGGSLIVRDALEGETLTLLDGKEVQLTAADLVVADSQKVLSLAGVMGGDASQVTAATREVILEVAEFEPTVVRRMAFRHQRRTDAATRFEKGIDPRLLPTVLEVLVNGLKQLAGTADFKVEAWGEALSPATSQQRVSMDIEWAKRWLAMDFSNEQAQKSLEQLGCTVTVPSARDGSSWSVVPPSFRRDLALREDIAEELARTIGLEHVRSTFPVLTTAPAIGSSGDSLEDRAKDALSALRFWETLSFSFQSHDWLGRFGLTPSVKLMNAMSQEQAYMVPSLLPGLVKCALENQNRHFSSDPYSYRIFELRPTFHRTGPAHPAGRESGVQESWKIALAISGSMPGAILEAADESFGSLRAVIEGLLARLGTKGLRIRPWVMPKDPEQACFETAVWHPGQSAEVWVGKQRVGVFGRMHPALETLLKLRQPLWLAELDWKAVVELTPGRSVVYRPQAEWTHPKFQTWGEHPGIERDFALIVSESETAEGLLQTAQKTGKPLLQSARVFDVYRGESVPAGKKSVAIRVHFGVIDRSLREDEVEPIAGKLIAAWKKQHAADLRS